MHVNVNFIQHSHNNQHEGVHVNILTLSGFCLRLIAGCSVSLNILVQMRLSPNLHMKTFCDHQLLSYNLIKQVCVCEREREMRDFYV